jgi:rSAM/selenodomain-associated transferase 1
LLAAAAMIAVLIGSWAALDSMNSRKAQSFEASLDQSAQVLKIGLSDHINCAVMHGQANRRFTPEQMAERMGADYIGLVPVVKEKAPAGYEVVVAHKCHTDKREFVHMILKNEDKVLSLIITKKSGEAFPKNAALEVIEAAGIPLYEARMQDYEVAGFETRDYLGFIVSNLSKDDNLQIASTITPAVRLLLEDGSMNQCMSNSHAILDPSKRASVAPSSCVLAVVAKAPRAGAVKTRLVPPLTHDEAAALSVCFLRDTAANIADVTRASNAQAVVVYTPIGAESEFDGLLPDGFSLLAQRGDNLSDRLIHAAEDLLSIGYESFCLINSDSPTLPPEALASAVDCLARPGDRVVLGATDDGGYYLIGLKRAHRRLFAGIEWSTARVLSQTMERAAEINLEVELLPAWYDVDDAESLGRLCEEVLSSNEGAGLSKATGYPAPHTRNYLTRLIEAKGLK